MRKRDFTEEQEDFKGFNIKKRSSSDTKYDPMGIFKAKLAGDDEVGRVEGPVEASEGDGKVKLELLIEDSIQTTDILLYLYLKEKRVVSPHVSLHLQFRF